MYRICQNKVVGTRIVRSALKLCTITQEIAQENNIGVDVKGFDKEMSAQKERAKAASQIIDLTLEGSLEREIDLFDKTFFNGYDSLDSDAEIKGIFFESTLVKQASEERPKAGSLQRYQSYTYLLSNMQNQDLT